MTHEPSMTVHQGTARIAGHLPATRDVARATVTIAEIDEQRRLGWPDFHPVHEHVSPVAASWSSTKHWGIEELIGPPT